MKTFASRHWILLKIASFVAAGCLAAALTANAQTVRYVGTTADLINAINAINGGGGGDTITLTANITLTASLPTLTKSVTVEGQNHTLSGNNAYQIFTVNGGSVVVRDAALNNGYAAGASGGTGGYGDYGNSTTAAGAGGGGGAGYNAGQVSNGSNGGNSIYNGSGQGGAAGTGGGVGGTNGAGGSAVNSGAGGGGGSGGSGYLYNGSHYYTGGSSGGSSAFGGGSGGSGGTGGYYYNSFFGSSYYAGGGGGGGGSLGAGGAALVTGGSVTYENVSFDGNSAVGGAGGAGGASNSRVGGSGGNGGSAYGGAIFVGNGTTMNLTNSSFGASNSVTAGAAGAAGIGYTANGYAGSAGGAVGADIFLYNGTLNYKVDAGSAQAKLYATYGTLNKIGSGTLALSGNSGYLNAVVSAGTLAFGSASALGTGSTVNVNGGGLDVSTYNGSLSSLTLTSGTVTGTTGSLYAYNFDLRSGTVSAALSGYGVTKSTTGTVTLTGANTYTGGTLVSVGALLAKNSAGSATGNGTVTVQSGGTLGGNGTVSGPVTVQSGGVLAPGFDVMSRLNLGNTLTLNSGSLLAITIGNAAPGDGYDQVFVNGALTLGGNLQVTTINGYTLTVGQMLTVLDNTGSGSTTGTFSNASGLIYVNAAGQSFLVNYAADGDGDALPNDVTLTYLGLNVVPEPSSWAYSLIGVCALTLIVRRRMNV